MKIPVNFVFNVWCRNNDFHLMINIKRCQSSKFHAMGDILAMPPEYC